MKMKLANISFIIISLVFASCGDIIDSDKNIKTITDYKLYKSVKTDQEHDVIMPLKVGNKWYYYVSEFYSTGDLARKYLDSIIVKSEVTINGERWFKCRYPMVNPDYDILLTNTDLGLWMKCDECNKASYLLALYPADKERFNNGKFELSAIGPNLQLIMDSCINWLDYQMDNNKIGKYPTSYKYSMWWESIITGKYYKPVKVSNFVPGVGIIRFELYPLDIADSTLPSGTHYKGIHYLYELLDEITEEKDLEALNLPDILDFGKLSPGFIKDTVKQFTNSSLIKILTLNNLELTNNSKKFMSALNGQFNVPFDIKPQEAFNLVFRFNASGNPGVYYDTLTFNQSKNYYLVLKGEIIP